MEYKLYSYFPDDGRLDWWIKHMDADWVGEEYSIDFRAKIIEVGYTHPTLEWFYCYEDIKIFTKQFNPNGAFYREFKQTYCKCYDDDSDY